VAAAPERGRALDADRVAAGALDACAHGGEAACEIDHLGLARRVLDQRGAFGEARRHHQVLGPGHGDQIHDDARAAQALCFGVHVAVLDRDRRSHRLQALHVLVHRAQPDGAAAGQRHLGPPASREQRAEHQHRGAHGLHELVGRGRIGDPCRVEAHLGAGALDFDAHLPEKPRHGGDVDEPRHVGEPERLCAEERGAHDRQRGVLRARNRHLAFERPAAADLELIHRPSTPRA
jgi:hypothetical protein